MPRIKLWKVNSVETILLNALETNLKEDAKEVMFMTFFMIAKNMDLWRTSVIRIFRVPKNAKMLSNCAIQSR